MNSFQLGADNQNDFELENAAFNFNALTMLPKEDKNIPSVGSKTNKPNFESIGTFKGIKDFSDNLNDSNNQNKEDFKKQDLKLSDFEEF